MPGQVKAYELQSKYVTVRVLSDECFLTRFQVKKRLVETTCRLEE